MFKKVRSLLVSGLLVMGMSGSVFADTCIMHEESFKAVQENFHTVITASGGEQDKDYYEEHNAILYKIEEADRISDDAWEKFKKDISDNYENGMNIDKIAQVEGYDTAYAVYFDEDFNGKLDEHEKEHVVALIYADLNNTSPEEKGWVPDITPGTGDAIALGGLAIAGIAAGALALNNKKKNKK